MAEKKEARQDRGRHQVKWEDEVQTLERFEDSKSRSRRPSAARRRRARTPSEANRQAWRLKSLGGSSSSSTRLQVPRLTTASPASPGVDVRRDRAQDGADRGHRRLPGPGYSPVRRPTVLPGITRHPVPAPHGRGPVPVRHDREPAAAVPRGDGGHQRRRDRRRARPQARVGDRVLQGRRDPEEDRDVPPGVRRDARGLQPDPVLPRRAPGAVRQAAGGGAAAPR
jgi:hypothetical protein